MLNEGIFSDAQSAVPNCKPAVTGATTSPSCGDGADLLTLSNVVAVVQANEYGIDDMSATTLVWLRQAVTQLSKFLKNERIHMAEITPRQIDEWKKHELQRDLSPITVNTYLRGIKTIYSRLLRKGLMDANPAEPVSFLPEPPPEPKAISEEDYLKMHEATTTVRDKALISTLWATGCRAGGIVNMRLDKMKRWEEEGEVRFSLLVTEKFSKSRWVYAKGQEAEYLDAWLQQRNAIPTTSKALFTTLRRPFNGLTEVGILRLTQRLGEMAELTEPHNPHSFRHAFAIRMLEAGYDIAAVSSWLGHSRPEFTARVYVIRSEAQLRKLYFT